MFPLLLRSLLLLLKGESVQLGPSFRRRWFTRFLHTRAPSFPYPWTFPRFPLSEPLSGCVEVCVSRAILFKSIFLPLTPFLAPPQREGKPVSESVKFYLSPIFLFFLLDSFSHFPLTRVLFQGPRSPHFDLFCPISCQRTCTLYPFHIPVPSALPKKR